MDLNRKVGDVYELTAAHVTAARSIALNNDKQYILAELQPNRRIVPHCTRTEFLVSRSRADTIECIPHTGVFRQSSD